jgi:hypothetical protein
MDTKFTHDGLVILITGGTFCKPKFMSEYVAMQVRVTYEDGTTNYLGMEDIEVMDESMAFHYNP